jgi:hypothetical protein
MLTMGHPSSVTRELLIRVVTHCLLVIMRDAMERGASADPRQSGDDAARARAWWATWENLRSEQHDGRVLEAVDSMSDTMTRVDRAARAADEAKHAAHHDASPGHESRGLSAKMQILHSPSFKAAVRQALSSAILVLTLRARHFRELDPDHIGPPLFGRLLEKIALAQDEESNAAYLQWLGRHFASWLHRGEVLPEHRPSFVWSRLLLGSRDHLIQGGEGSFMRSQLSVLLAMWHDAVTHGQWSKTNLDRIIALGVVHEKEAVATVD